MKAYFARRLILQLLKEASPHALPEKELMAQVDARAGRPVGIHDFSNHLGWLWDPGNGRLIDQMDGDFGDGEKRWQITRAGEGYLRR